MNTAYEYEMRTADFYFRSDNRRSISLACGSHLHYHVEIAYIEEGSCNAYVDTECYTLQPSDMLVVFPNRVHRFDKTSGDEKYKLFIISPDLVPELLNQIRQQMPETPVIKGADKNKRLMSLVKILADTEKFSDQQNYDVMMKGYLLAFFGEVLGMLKMSQLPSEDSRALRAALEYCSQNFTHGITLSTLEKELGRSKYYISHLFGEKLGISFNEYINSLRVSEACRYLRFGERSITEISVLSGFGTLRTFNRVFIRQMGMPPSEYRRSNRMEYASASVLH